MRIDHIYDKTKYYTGQTIPFIKRVCIDYSRTHRIWRKKHKNGQYQYSVVVSVYNVEKYLDDFFKSIVDQTLDFKSHIWLILVDDGSTDSSASIIKKWQKLYPDNITYLYKENGGLNSARNYGLKRVKTPWVTFIDPDDFVDVTYFSHVDNFLKKHHVEGVADKEIKMLACNLIMYYEHNQRFFNKHPLKFKFKEKESIFKIQKLNHFMQLSVATAFFPVNDLIKKNILFDERKWAGFDDANLILRYLNLLDEGVIAFASLPRYYYRKRLAKNSNVDLGSLKKEKYLAEPRESQLELLEAIYKEKTNIPYFMQQIILYNSSWQIKQFLNNPPPFCLNPKETEEYQAILKNIFKYIDQDIIENYDSTINGFNWEHKVGTLLCLKNIKPSSQKVYIYEYDRVKNQLCLVYLGKGDETEDILVNGIKQEPVFTKNTQLTFAGKPFCIRRQVWIQLPEAKYTLSCNMDELDTQLIVEGRELSHIKKADIESAFVNCNLSNNSPYKDAWILMDRDIHADDSAEHLYRYIKNNYPAQEIFFALRKTSSDWKRLEAEGFNLLDFGSKHHERILLGCSKIISSHADHYVTDYFKGLVKDKHFVFLQHGVTKDNISRWLNSQKIDLFVTTTHHEYNSIVADGSPYMHSKRNTFLTGFPRHDALVPFIQQHENTILIMPTWRQSLVGKVIGKTNKRRPLGTFMQSQYAQAWQSFLISDYLKALTEKFKMNIIFFPHMNMQMYIPFFTIPNYIKVLSHSDSSIQNLFKQASIMITDYSSVAFEMAFLKKAVLYYQFDQETIFSGAAHLTLKGYFDYERDGFGPVVLDENTLLKELEQILKNNAQPMPNYLQRMEDLFQFRDGKNCERVYQSILELDKK
ncbi:CDP-glycerol glycerophosphotransferase family protein [Desulfovibrio litoralis]|uniref:CDP-glycerol glycerophosphotransferase, TagB/SpsB family n=1 Tax=Desulfovibrio litoralis DSM 11393 TaxID=1121455 RepID=A0A1M7RS35_9BACT|nr:CDP-glycerol glycerophosphotransferase family protein [Desulfovibrio litoralis]SHN49093.1 CDP-glycerol glycerophosphotransferase, TagB/SpsB family [Desulfovibrio litoralis DSM 11393]